MQALTLKNHKLTYNMAIDEKILTKEKRLSKTVFYYESIGRNLTIGF